MMENNQNNANYNSNNSNRVVRTGLFRGLKMLASASDFVLKRKIRCYLALEGPPSKRPRSNRSSSNNDKRSNKVHFHDQVQVRTIEHHSSYTEEERNAMWRSKEEIKAHAVRNRFERQWEGKDWRNAPEESDMLFDVRHGVRYHPCWTIPRTPYHSGEILYGSNNKRASFSRHLLQYMRKYGTTAFLEE
ncbi:unnamed protein product [Cylindrotheca closterium]|uniref:Uncharacterized protein n=1 Tax=Cylindrotheca closterium TaxID=2856 RepID=A0AAD2G2C3_9STRA|nr:unnamed protein product [Cylindrotheca closterium]